MVVAATIALVLLDRELKSYHYRDVMRQVWTLPYSYIALALLLTAVAYAVLPGYDAIIAGPMIQRALNRLIAGE
jgi:uncharacterized membrane protein YbhN (UPF0104 family)